MFAIVVSEKGGAERRELFDKHEINVGRVQGNDLMLPKGNVSKRHARLLYRDGRFIVTDLKSTNGTYVNGRKIAQATIVREGDKIYVGDFVLRVEAGLGTPTTPRKSSSSSVAALAPPLQLASVRPSSAIEGDVYARLDLPTASPPFDPNDATGRGVHDEPAPPTIGRSSGPSSTSEGLAGDAPFSTGRGVSMSPGPTTLAPRVQSQPSGPWPPSPAIATGRAMALTTLVDRVAEAIDLSPLSRGIEPDQVLAHRIERLTREKAKVLREEGQLPAGIEIDDTIHDAQRELLGLGALEPLLEDEEVSEICVFGHAQVTAVRGGEVIEIDPPFSGEAALQRAIVRLCKQSPAPLAAGETVVERYLSRGLLVQAILPPVSQYGHALVVRRRRRAETRLDDLVRSGTVSRAMATFLHGCAAARTNMLIVGPADGVALLLSALVSAAGASDRVAALQIIDELWGLEPAPISIRLPDTSEEGAKLVRAAARLRPDRMVVSPLAGQVAAAVACAVAEGAEGVIGVVPAPTLRHAIERLVPDLVVARPGTTAEAAEGSLLGTFELAVEVARLRDGRYRVMRIAELDTNAAGGIQGRDVFTFVVERTAAGGAVEGAFAPTGVVPRVAEDLTARGGPLDSSVFKRERG